MKGHALKIALITYKLIKIFQVKEQIYVTDS